MADYDMLRNLGQKRMIADAALEQDNINRLESTSSYQSIPGQPVRWDEPTELLFKMRQELITYITENGLVDGLIWDGILQPVQGSKIIITKDMIKIITDTFGYLTEPEATEIIMNILINGHYVQDENYVHTDNNFTNELLEKLEGLNPAAEENRVDDVTFNGVSVVEDKVAVIVITPENIKAWYESNPDTNAFTDEYLAIVQSVPGFISETNGNITRLDGRIDALDTRVTNEVTTINNRIDSELVIVNERIDDEVTALEGTIAENNAAINKKVDDLATDVNNQIGEVEGKIDSLKEAVDTNKGEADQRYTELDTSRIISVRVSEDGEYLIYELMRNDGVPLTQEIRVPKEPTEQTPIYNYISVPFQIPYTLTATTPDYVSSQEANFSSLYNREEWDLVDVFVDYPIPSGITVMTTGKVIYNGSQTATIRTWIIKDNLTAASGTVMATAKAVIRKVI